MNMDPDPSSPCDDNLPLSQEARASRVLGTEEPDQRSRVWQVLRHAPCLVPFQVERVVRWFGARGGTMRGGKGVGLEDSGRC